MIALVVVVGVLLALAIAGTPGSRTGSSTPPLVTETLPPTSSAFDASVPTIPPRSNLPSSVLSSTTTISR